MSVFNKKISENIEERKFIGANLPTNNYSFLTMYALSTSTSKSSIINNVLDEWINKNTRSISLLENEIAKKALDSFNNNSVTIDKFKSILEKELLAKGVLESSVKNIINIFTNETNK